MTKTLQKILRPDYLTVLKVAAMDLGHNNVSLARETQYSRAHIGNVFRGFGSDAAISAVCRVLGVSIRDLTIAGSTSAADAKDERGGMSVRNTA